MAKFGSAYTNIVTVTAAYTYDPTAGDARVDLILVDTTAGAITVTLPSPAGLSGQAGVVGSSGNDSPGRIRIANIGLTGYPVNITASSGTIRGESQLWTPYSVAEYISNYSNEWWQVAPFSRVQEVAIPLSSAAILALNATPLQLVAAPGTGKVVVVRGITLKMVTTATAYANGGALEFRYTNASGAKVSADIAAAVVTAAAGTSYTSVAGVTTSLTNVVNSGIFVNNATAPYITGTGTAVVGVSFEVLTL